MLIYRKTFDRCLCDNKKSREFKIILSEVSVHIEAVDILICLYLAALLFMIILNKIVVHLE